MLAVCSHGPGVCKMCGQGAIVHYINNCRNCLKLKENVRKSLQDLNKVDPQIVSDFKNLLSPAEKQEFYAKHHNLKHEDLMMQILQAMSESRKRMSESRKRRCIDRLRAKGKAVYEDGIRDKYVDLDESMMKKKNILVNGINVQCPVVGQSTAFDDEQNYIDKVVCDAMHFSKLRIADELKIRNEKRNIMMKE